LFTITPGLLLWCTPAQVLGHAVTLFRRGEIIISASTGETLHLFGLPEPENRDLQAQKMCIVKPGFDLSDLIQIDAERAVAAEKCAAGSLLQNSVMFIAIT
jgi:hypothetical protein